MTPYERWYVLRRKKARLAIPSVPTSSYTFDSTAWSFDSSTVPTLDTETTA